ncbi:zinc finger and BTB domain-containing protein 6 isoform X1 [Lingula anatina]|uniref:Zinc finger and BTB domain-containing protein 6 isoform X1 n=1 Tax=Lingula anatina TaxID=7574 RepID=A0A1S3J7D5_LINAN|nr:zinc finger and BTB domain-containing protein 6 isoform X1 [Lingula anatina]|eukprot:XP_013406327.1 zinc finger and BTB domain-containing protein 6 isoform X1 [Lingula anatina]
MLKISKLDINLPVELVKSCATLPDSQLCKFVATNQDGEFQHSIEVRNKQDNVISLELSNLEISYEDGRFVAQIMQVFKVFQGESMGQDSAASTAAVPNAPPRPSEGQGFTSPQHKRDGMAGKKKTQTSETSSSSVSVSDSGMLRTADASQTAVSQISNRPLYSEPSHHPVPAEAPVENVVLPRQMFRNVHGAKRPEPSAALGSPVHESTPMASKRIRIGTEEESSPSQASQTNVQDSSQQLPTQDQSEHSLIQGDTKPELIEIKIESEGEDDKSEDTRSDGQNHSQDAFLSQSLPPSFDNNQTTPFIQDFYSLTQDQSGAGQNLSSGALSFPSTSSQALVPPNVNWQPAGDSSSSMDPPGQSPSKPRNVAFNRRKCPHCQFSADRIAHVKRHIISFHGDNSNQIQFAHRCNVCAKPFDSKFGLRYHLSSAHGAQGNYECEHYGKRFVIRQLYQEHLDYHSNVQRHTCHDCDQGFRRREALRRHITKVHCKKPMPCTKCPEIYSSIEALQAHMSDDHS